MSCQDYERYFYKYINGLADIPEEVVSHIQDCDGCRKELDRLGNELQASACDSGQKQLIRKHLTLQAGLIDEWVSCEHVKPFLPAMLIDFLHISQQTPITAHIQKCQKCREHLEQIRGLNLPVEGLIAAANYFAGNDDLSKVTPKARQVLEGINASDEPAIETRMRSDLDSADKAIVSSPNYTTQVRYKQKVNLNARPRPLKYVLAAGISVAAIVMLLVLPATVSGLNLQTLNKSVKNAANIHIQRFSSEGQKIQEIWLSRSLGFKLYRQSEVSLFKDLQTGRIMQKQADGQVTYLSEGGREEEPYARVLPFEHLKDLPAKYEWSYKGDWESESGQSLRIYELAWDYSSSDIIINKIWRAYLDPDTHLPYVIEWLERTPVDEEYNLITVSRIDYPNESTCLEQLAEGGFQRFLKLDHLE